MTEVYETRSTSNKTARVEDIWLNPPADANRALTRRVVRAELIDNERSRDARVKVCLLHQKRHSRTAPWKDVEAFDRRQLGPGQEVRLTLDTSETLQLFSELERLYGITESGIPKGERRFQLIDENEVVVVRGSTRELIQQLINAGDGELWKSLAELQPNIFKAAALSKLHEAREQAVAAFAIHLKRDDWSESDWQGFFEENTWIFGYGLSYQFLKAVQSQPIYQGADLDGAGAQRGDFLMRTEADLRFTVLVEIKKPSTTLVSDRVYRNKCHLLGAELIGGISQLQVNCRNWEIEGSRHVQNQDKLERREDTYTVAPRGILVIGNMKELRPSRDKLTTFEVFRRNLQNPEVITFDELLERARHILLNQSNDLGTPSP